MGIYLHYLIFMLLYICSVEHSIPTHTNEFKIRKWIKTESGVNAKNP